MTSVARLPKEFAVRSEMVTVSLLTFIVICLTINVIDCTTGSGTLSPLVGRLDNFRYETYIRMASESECILLCLHYEETDFEDCYAVSYQGVMERCDIFTEPLPTVIQPTPSSNWVSYIKIIDS
ncbi:unnamed protein product [Didymodactylos carnosus]|uniref:Uncharacterized protein n=1 Tax=Didymodactylos carnosus TaxID=1234261 RepID=A0A814DZ15_9BILA|nr:unnamed protein product [Didymodactylos carnosus]CAF0962044.1 unnamed protein product [Didymodactylos carnosus]CAF3598909.1 unnamed protein product [Didymodactylos carnosus]CAF3736478.1 unnamed protein product [Didymodactylos carnosus]